MASTFALWATSTDFTNGAPPLGAFETIKEVKDAAARSFAPSRPTLVIGRSTKEGWSIHAFFNAKRYRTVGKAQQRKYAAARARAVSKQGVEDPTVLMLDPVPVTDETPEPEPTATEPEQPTRLVLTLAPAIVGLLRDTFTLVADGRPVTIELDPSTVSQETPTG